MPIEKKNAADGHKVEQMDIERANVMVDRDSSTSLPVMCFEYEVDILREIHGEMSVRQLSTTTDTVDAFTAAEAYATLLRKYKQNIEAVRMVYRSPKELAKASGLSYKQGDDEAVKFQQAEVLVGGKEEGEPARKS